MITELPNLEELHLSNNRLERVELSGLRSLRQLHLANNQLKTLPFSLFQMDLHGLTVSNNPLKFPPLAVCRRGLEGMKAYVMKRWETDSSDDKLWMDNPYYDSDGDDTDYEDVP